MKSRLKDEDWFSIVAKDNSCRGYIPAKDKEEACKKFGLKAKVCIIERVRWSGKEFVELNQAKQGKLL